MRPSWEPIRKLVERPKTRPHDSPFAFVHGNSRQKAQKSEKFIYVCAIYAFSRLFQSDLDPSLCLANPT